MLEAQANKGPKTSQTHKLYAMVNNKYTYKIKSNENKSTGTSYDTMLNYTNNTKESISKNNHSHYPWLELNHKLKPAWWSETLAKRMPKVQVKVTGEIIGNIRVK